MNIHAPIEPGFNFDNTYARELEGFYTPWQAATVPVPKLLAFNRELAAELGLDAERLNSAEGAAIFAGNTAPPGATPLAQAYAGHQFGGFSPSLGDGRALLLGELIDRNGNRRDLQLKGSGRTPFSRGGDGKAALGPVLREYLMGEAMHALGLPTTRALAAVATGEPVLRERALPGAVLARVASSHIRVGTFQYFAVRKQWDKIQQLASYVTARHYPAAAREENPTLSMFLAVLDAQAELVAGWMHVGFIHGVMNTDNMSIAGETIDYGPCAFMDRYAPSTVFSSIDAHGRYAYANQPLIAQWNLTRFAETLITATDPDEHRAIDMLTNAINEFPDRYMRCWLAGMRAKIGLTSALHGDLNLVNNLFAALENQNVDYTRFFRSLSDAARGDMAATVSLFDDPSAFEHWTIEWRDRLSKEADCPSECAERMDRVNPIYIPRNHKVEEAITAAVDHDDLGAFTALLEIVKQPFIERESHEQESDERESVDAYAGPAPLDAPPYRTFCGT